MTELINGINFQCIAEYIWDQDRRDNISRINKNTIIWCKTDYLQSLFDELRDVRYNIILITHCSDHSITEERFNTRPLCVRKWFAQNVDCVHPDLIPLPIGIENHIGVNRGSSIDITIIKNNSFDFAIRNKIINKVYSNFSLSTHFNRLNVYRALYDNKMISTGARCSYDSYIQDIKNHLFIASPRGNGIDCHRTWEALYCGSIPLVDKHFMYDTYKNLPIIQVEDWNSINADILKPYVEKYRNSDIFTDVEMLKLTYWLDMIKLMLTRL